MRKRPVLKHRPQIVEEPIQRFKRRMGSLDNMQDRKISNVK